MRGLVNSVCFSVHWPCARIMSHGSPGTLICQACVCVSGVPGLHSAGPIMQLWLASYQSVGTPCITPQTCDPHSMSAALSCAWTHVQVHAADYFCSVQNWLTPKQLFNEAIWHREVCEAIRQSEHCECCGEAAPLLCFSGFRLFLCCVQGSRTLEASAPTCSTSTQLSPLTKTPENANCLRSTSSSRTRSPRRNRSSARL